jgi:hypothetical protein
MAKVIKIPKGSLAPYTIESTGKSYEVSKGVTLSSDTDTIINEYNAGTSNRIGILGRLKSTDDSFAIYSTGEATAITVAKSGTISASSTGIGLGGENQTLTNLGSISAGLYAISAEQEFTRIINKGDLDSGDSGTAIYITADTGSSNKVLNDGSITGHNGIHWDEAYGVLTLGKHSIIHVRDTAVRHDSAGDQYTLTTNNGTIKAPTAYYAAEGNDSLTNNGKITGDIILGSGNDVFDSSKGVFKGTVWGQAGDDTYHISSARAVVREDIGDGSDDLFSSVSYTLAIDGEIEDFTLVGKANINATGDNADNFITGNKGNNILAGLDGIDYLTGGRGGDIFMMATGWGFDSITDFADGIDKIDVGGWTGISGFADLSGFMSQSESGVMIEVGEDRLYIFDAVLADFDKKDFLF